MTSVDELFKRSDVPTGGSLKRKYEVPDAHAAYKAAKLGNDRSPSGLQTRPHATLQEVDDEDDGLEAGPALPDDDGVDEDEEGRFFGGGVSKDTSQALQYLDELDGGEEYTDEQIDSAWLRRLAAAFDRKVNKNAELRARYEDEPQKFMESEADLDAEIKTWSIVSEHPELYSELAESGAVATIVNLIAHENTDISIGAIEILAELLDEDVNAEHEHWERLVTSLLDADLLDLLMSNFARLDESGEADQNGIYHSLALLESIAGFAPFASQIATPKLLTWLCNRINSKEPKVSQNKQYAAEVLQVLLQVSKTARQLLAKEVDGVDLLLQLLAPFRKRDPEKDTHEEEYVENLFDALTCVLDETEGKDKFVEAEGVELCLIMLKEGHMSKIRALRLLDHAASSPSSSDSAAIAVCEKIVEAAGLKTLFGMFMKKSDRQTVEHILGIQSSMLRNLPGESAARIRLIAKFTEKRYEKLDRLIQLHLDYSRKMRDADSNAMEQIEFCAQTINVSIAWLIAEDSEARNHIASRVKLSELKTALEDQLDSLSAESDEEEDVKEMLVTLISFVE